MFHVTEQLSTFLGDRYRIERSLGAGGMATVYLADDLKHDRKVALKVLRPELAAALGAERFAQEIKTTARLQHPHILPLYDSGSAAAAHGGSEILYYVMPYVRGETLRAKLGRELQLGIDEAVRIATEVADALHYAHERGLVHRDVKPENILLHDDRAMVADFGIALAVSAAGGGRMTQTGVSLGTPHYMSPEQAAAERHVTHRSDIYSLGAVLYEMLTGELPHTGSSAQAIVFKIVSDEPRPVRELRRAVPPHVATAVAKALEKLPADRFDSAKAFADALRGPAVASPAAAVDARSRGVLRPALATSMLAISALAAWGWLRPGDAGSVSRFATTLDATGTLDGIALRLETALSPDGGALVFRHPLKGPGQLYVKRRDEVMARPLAGTEGGSGPFFSPDGAWIGFVANGQLRKVPSAGGASLKLVDSVDPALNSGAWLTDGSIYFYDAVSHTLRRLPPGESAPQVVASPATLGGRFPWLPAPLPDSRGILFTAHLTNCVGPVSCRPSRVYVYDAGRDTIRALFDDAVGAWHVPTGHVLYLTSGGTLMAAPWDNQALSATGTPVPILDGIQAPGLVVSAEGTAVYLLGPPEFASGPTPNAEIVWVDRRGQVEPVDASWRVNTGGGYTTSDRDAGWSLALSPDGGRVALTLLTDVGTDVWIKQLPTGPVSRLTLHPGEDRAPAWTADGRAITFLSDRPTGAQAPRRAGRMGVWTQAADGTGEPRLLWDQSGATDAFPSPDGRWLVLGSVGSRQPEAGGDILAAPLGTDATARRIVASGYDEGGAALSPDSRWLAYASTEQGATEVFVRPFPDVDGGKWQVSSGGGSAPLWSRDGRELYFISGNHMYVVRVRAGPTFSADSPRVLFALPDRVRRAAMARGTFAIAPDGQRFLMVRDRSWEEMAGTGRMVVVQNFFAELRAKTER